MENACTCAVLKPCSSAVLRLFRDVDDKAATCVVVRLSTCVAVRLAKAVVVNVLICKAENCDTGII